MDLIKNKAKDKLNIKKINYKDVSNNLNSVDAAKKIINKFINVFDKSKNSNLNFKPTFDNIKRSLKNVLKFNFLHDSNVKMLLKPQNLNSKFLLPAVKKYNFKNKNKRTYDFFFLNSIFNQKFISILFIIITITAFIIGICVIVHKIHMVGN